MLLKAPSFIFGLKFLLSISSFFANPYVINNIHIKLIKERRYRYNPNNKSWNITLNDEEKINEEKNWLTDNIYNGTFKGIIIMITVFDKYKDND